MNRSYQRVVTFYDAPTLQNRCYRWDCIMDFGDFVTHVQRRGSRTVETVNTRAAADPPLVDVQIPEETAPRAARMQARRLSRESVAPDKNVTSPAVSKQKVRVPGPPGANVPASKARKQSMIRTTAPKKPGDSGASLEQAKEESSSEPAKEDNSSSSSSEEDQAQVVEEDPAKVVERAHAREQERKERHERERARLEAEVEDVLSRRGRPWLEDNSDSSDDGKAVLSDVFATMDDPFISPLDLDNDASGKMPIVDLLHKVFHGDEIEVDGDEELEDESGRLAYLLLCRKYDVRPSIPALMQLSSQFLFLQHFGLNQQQAVTLSAALKLNITVTQLNLSNNMISPVGVAHLAKLLRSNHHIRTLVLRSTAAGPEGGTALAKTLAASTSLQSLDVRSNKIGDTAAAKIAEALHINTSLSSLILADNQVATKGSLALADMLLINETLTNLDLSWNHIRPPELKHLCGGLERNWVLRSLSLAWNGIGGNPAPSSPRRGQTAAPGSPPTHSSSPRSKLSSATGVTDARSAGEALVRLIRRGGSITELDVSHCRLGRSICHDLAAAIRENTTLEFLLLDGNPMGDDAIELLKELKARMLAGSIQKFSMNNCCFDPSTRQLSFDSYNPSGHYILDLSDEEDRECVKLLLSEGRRQKTEIFRNERLNGTRISLTPKGGMLSTTGNWNPPAEGKMEFDIITLTSSEPGQEQMKDEELRILTRLLESTTNDAAKLHYLKQACLTFHLDISQVLVILYQFQRDISRENALIAVFASITDHRSVYVCHTALSERSRWELQKRIGPLYMMNRYQPAGRYWFDLTKRDDQSALRIMMQLKANDASAKFENVRFAYNIEDTQVEVLPGSKTWKLLFPSDEDDEDEGRVKTPGTPEEVVSNGILELEYTCSGVQDHTFKSALMQAIERKMRLNAERYKRDRPLSGYDGRSSGASSRNLSSRGGQREVLSVDSRPGTRGSSRGSVRFQPEVPHQTDARPKSSEKRSTQRQVSGEDEIRPFSARGILGRSNSTERSIERQTSADRGSSRGSVRFGLPLQTPLEQDSTSEEEDPAGH